MTDMTNIRTFAEALFASEDVFVKWRYMHQQQCVDASLGEMRRAFAALADGM